MRQGHCAKDCDRAETTLKKVAASYHVLGEHTQQPTDSYIDSQTAFFAMVRCDKKELSPICKEAHKFDKVPKLVHIRSQTFRRRQQVIHFRPQHIYYTTNYEDEEQMLHWCKGFAPRVKLVIFKDLFTRLRKMIPIFGYGVALLAVLIVGAVLVRKIPFLMVILACAVQWY